MLGVWATVAAVTMAVLMLACAWTSTPQGDPRDVSPSTSWYPPGPIMVAR